MTSPHTKNSDETPDLITSRTELILFMMRDAGMSLRQAESMFNDLLGAVETTRRNVVDVRCSERVIPLDSTSDPDSTHRELEEHFTWFVGRSVRLRQRSLSVVD